MHSSLCGQSHNLRIRTGPCAPQRAIDGSDYTQTVKYGEGPLHIDLTGSHGDGSGIGKRLIVFRTRHKLTSCDLCMVVLLILRGIDKSDVVVEGHHGHSGLIGDPQERPCQRLHLSIRTTPDSDDAYSGFRTFAGFQRESQTIAFRRNAYRTDMLCIVKSGNRQRARPAVGVDGNLLRRFVNGPNLFPSAFASVSGSGKSITNTKSTM